MHAHGNFLDTAASITQLYSESGEVCSRGIDLGIDYGYQKRTREILNWLKKKKKAVKRDELLAFLSGLSQPVDLPCLPTQESFNPPRFFNQVSEFSCPSTDAEVKEFSDNMFTPRTHQMQSPQKRTTLRLKDPAQVFQQLCSDHSRKRASLSPCQMNVDLPTSKRSRHYDSSAEDIF